MLPIQVSLGLIPGQGTGSHMPTTKTWCSQVNKYFKPNLACCSPAFQAPRAAQTFRIFQNIPCWTFHCAVELACVHAQACVTLCDPMDCSLPGSSVRGILQARILEWIAISFSRGSSWPRDRTWVSCKNLWQILYCLSQLGSAELPNGYFLCFA